MGSIYYVCNQFVVVVLCVITLYLKTHRLLYVYYDNNCISVCVCVIF